MSDADRLDFNESTHLLDEEDEETLAAIDRGLDSAGEGRVISAEDVRRKVEAWITK